MEWKEDSLIPDRQIVLVPLEAHLQVVVLVDELVDCFPTSNELVDWQSLLSSPT